jgi:hypothetical protein
VLSQPVSAALPSRLSDYWLDCALQGAEQLVGADKAGPSDLVHIPLSMVAHLTIAAMESQGGEIPDEELFRFLKLYRWELAMEKLRRWGVSLTPAATEETIFRSRFA